MQNAAQGGVARTLAQAEVSIGNVISNRNALAASAATPPAPAALGGHRTRVVVLPSTSSMSA
jgi:hypothetical protein